MRVRVLLSLLLLCPMPLLAANGDVLLEKCEVPHINFEQAVCVGYLGGTYDAYLEEAISAKYYCRPAGVSQEKLRLVILRYLEKERPESLHLDAATLALAAFAEAWPCQQ